MNILDFYPITVGNQSAVTFKSTSSASTGFANSCVLICRRPRI